MRGEGGGFSLGFVFKVIKFQGKARATVFHLFSNALLKNCCATVDPSGHSSMHSSGGDILLPCPFFSQTPLRAILLL